MWELELRLSKQAVRLAGQVCRRVRSGVSWKSKADSSPVTVADYAAQVVILRALWAQFPGDRVVAEEEGGALRRDPELLDAVVGAVREAYPEITPEEVLALMEDPRSHRSETSLNRYWALDPIDGTAGFLRPGGQYAIALALLEHGHPVVAVLGCPALPEKLDSLRVFSASDDNSSPTSGLDGEGAGSLVYATRELHTAMEPLFVHVSGAGVVPSQRVRVCEPSTPADLVLAESYLSSHSNFDISSRLSKHLGIRAAPVRLDSQCKYALLARGEISLFFRLPTKPDYRECVWDHAAGALLVEQAGGVLSDASGAQLDYGAGSAHMKSVGIIATVPRHHRAVVEAAVASAHLSRA